MLRSIAIGLAALLSLVSSTANAQFFSNLATFNAQLQGPSYLEQFTGLGFGTVQGATWDAPGANGFDYTISSSGALFSIPDAMSVASTADNLIFTFTGAPVFAFGGNFYSSDFDGNLVPNVNVTFQASDGGTQTYAALDFSSSFLGYVSSVPLVSVTIQDDSSVNNWVAADNVIVGVPEPSALLLVGMAVSGLTFRRRK